MPVIPSDPHEASTSPFHETEYTRDSKPGSRIHRQYCKIPLRHRSGKKEPEVVMWMSGCWLKVLRGVLKGWVGVLGI